MNPTFVMIYLLIINAELISPYILSKVDLLFRSIFVGIIFLFYFLHLFPNGSNVLTQDRGIRYGLGFNEPNKLATEVLAVIFSFVIFISYKKYRKFNKYKLINSILIILLFIFSLIVYKASLSRGFIISIIVIFISLLFNNKIYLIFKHMFIFIILSLIFTSYFVIFYDSNSRLYNFINTFTSGRVGFLHKAISIYPINLFGYNSFSLLKTISNSNSQLTVIPIDNLYVWLILSSGIIGLFIYLFILFKSSYFASKLNDRMLCVVLISLIIFIMTESVSDLYFPFVYAFSEYNFKKYE